FTVVNVADGADVNVRFVTLKLFLSHSLGAFLNIVGSSMTRFPLRARLIRFTRKNQDTSLDARRLARD
ncbi:hypothetical protein, partial [Tritonibacter aquimaris]|uniref:hypothetical protein n=1 Tax=Tritonibacter aquimaris TaxID=2663379 RepID=UPI001BE46D87